MMKIKYLILLVIGLVFVGGAFCFIKSWGREIEDFRILTINEVGVVLRSVSWQRKMVNVIVVESDIKIWIPKGMGWYRSDKVKQLLISQNKQDLADDVAFYNFGFIPDVVIYGNDDNWMYHREVLRKWGVINLLRYFMNNTKLMVKDEVVSDDLVKSTDFLNNIVQRDLAESRLLKEDLRLTVFNQGQSSGLAGFISRILEWSGFTVIGVENSGGNDVDGCVINYGNKVTDTYGFEVLKKRFKECKYSENNNLGNTEMELYFGDKY